MTNPVFWFFALTSFFNCLPSRLSCQNQRLSVDTWEKLGWKAVIQRRVLDAVKQWVFNGKHHVFPIFTKSLSSLLCKRNEVLELTALKQVYGASTSAERDKDQRFKSHVR